MIRTLQAPGAVVCILLATLCARAARPEARQSGGAGSVSEPEMVDVAAATFTMGDPGWAHTAPRSVRVAAFMIGRYEVSRAEFLPFAAAERVRLPEPPAGVTARHPISGITWSEAAAFARWLEAETGRPYRLPREEEWELAARGGLEGRAYEWGDDEPGPALVRANVADAAAMRKYAPWLARPLFSMAATGFDDGQPSLAPVGQFSANRFGLHDMTGNVAEWCEDDYMVAGERPGMRSVRGASLLSRDATALRVGRRAGLLPGTRSIGVGLRLAMTVTR